MHPELLNNPTFLRYYSRWQADPTSAAFVGVADFLRQYRLYDDALRVCETGLQRNPELVSARLVLSRIHLERGEHDEAAVQLTWIIARQPQHREALRLLGSLGLPPPVAPPVASPAAVPPTWATVTMARLYEQQGHPDQAAMIYRVILDREPDNAEARDGLQLLQRV